MPANSETMHPLLIARSVILRRVSLVETYGFKIQYIVVEPNDEIETHENRNVNSLEDSFFDAPPLDEPIKIALVHGVLQNSPAFRAGLSNGERILAVNSKPITALSYEDLVRIIQNSGINLNLMLVPCGSNSTIHSPSVHNNVADPRMFMEVSPGECSTGRIPQHDIANTSSVSNLNYCCAEPDLYDNSHYIYRGVPNNVSSRQQQHVALEHDSSHTGNRSSGISQTSRSLSSGSTSTQKLRPPPPSYQEFMERKQKGQLSPEVRGQSSNNNSNVSSLSRISPQSMLPTFLQRQAKSDSASNKLAVNAGASGSSSSPMSFYSALTSSSHGSPSNMQPVNWSTLVEESTSHLESFGDYNLSPNLGIGLDNERSVNSIVPDRTSAVASGQPRIDSTTRAGQQQQQTSTNQQMAMSHTKSPLATQAQAANCNQQIRSPINNQQHATTNTNATIGSPQHNTTISKSDQSQSSGGQRSPYPSIVVNSLPNQPMAVSPVSGLPHNYFLYRPYILSHLPEIKEASGSSDESPDSNVKAQGLRILNLTDPSLCRPPDSYYHRQQKTDEGPFGQSIEPLDLTQEDLEYPSSAPPRAYPAVISPFPPINNPFKSGHVPQLSKSMSWDSNIAAQRMALKNRIPKEQERLSQCQLVRVRTKAFEDGSVDSVGPLKLYHQQASKRELEKIITQNNGAVLLKAACFEAATASPGRLSISSTCTNEYLEQWRESQSQSISRDGSLAVDPRFSMLDGQHSPTMSEPANRYQWDALRPPWITPSANGVPSVGSTSSDVAKGGLENRRIPPVRQPSFLNAVDAKRTALSKLLVVPTTVSPVCELTPTPFTSGYTSLDRGMIQKRISGALITPPTSPVRHQRSNNCNEMPSPRKVCFADPAATENELELIAPSECNNPTARPGAEEASTTKHKLFTSLRRRLKNVHRAPFLYRRASDKSRIDRAASMHEYLPPPSDNAIGGAKLDPESRSAGNFAELDLEEGQEHYLDEVSFSGQFKRFYDLHSPVPKHGSHSLQLQRRSYHDTASMTPEPTPAKATSSPLRVNKSPQARVRPITLMESTTNVDSDDDFMTCDEQSPPRAGTPAQDLYYDDTDCEESSATPVVKTSTPSFGVDYTSSQSVTDTELRMLDRRTRFTSRSPATDTNRNSRRGSYVIATSDLKNGNLAGQKHASKSMSENAPPRPEKLLRDAQGNLQISSPVTVYNGNKLIYSTSTPPANFNFDATPRQKLRRQEEIDVDKLSVASSSTHAVSKTPSTSNRSSLSVYQNHISHKQTKIERAKRAPDRQWKSCWGIVQNQTLYLSKDRARDSMVQEGSAVDDSQIIDIRDCIVDIAYDYIKRKHVFRLTCQDQSEHLMQARDKPEMLDWIARVQSSATIEDPILNDGQITNSMALIIKRYEQQNQSHPAVSPVVKPKKPGFLRLQNKTPSAETVEHPTDPPNGGTSSKTSTPSSGGKFSRKKMKKVVKSGSCPVATVVSEDACFGRLIEELPTVTQNSAEDDDIPWVVKLCVSIVDTHGLDSTGIYRVPGNSAAVNSLIASMNKGFDDVNFDDPRWKDVNVVSSILKAFFRKLPDPLLTDSLYPSFIQANRLENHSERLKGLRALLDRMPKVNYETLKFLILHLCRVVAHCHLNKMESRNLALMFGPSLIRPSGDSMTTMVSDMSDQCKLVETFIYYCDWLLLQPVGSPIPPQLPADQAFQPASASFSDMNDLLRRVSKTEDDLNVTKENILKSIRNMRRPGRKGDGAKKRSPEKTSSVHEPLLEVIGDITPTTESHNKTGPVISLRLEDPMASTSGLYQERNIDEEIALRKSRVEEEVTSPTENDLSVRSNTPQSRSASRDSRTEFELVAEEMRRKREASLYTARRMFILGPSGAGDSPNSTAVNFTKPMKPSPSESQTPDSLPNGEDRHVMEDSGFMTASTSSHSTANSFNLTPRSLEVLSPETRERVRQYQQDPMSLSVRTPSQRTPSATRNGTHDSPHRPPVSAVDDMAASMTSFASSDVLMLHKEIGRQPLMVQTSNDSFHHQGKHTKHRVSGDSLSITSDYSTTSSNFGVDGSGGQYTMMMKHSLVAPPSAGSSCSGSGNPTIAAHHSAFGASSDYSSNASPTTPHLPKRDNKENMPVGGSASMTNVQTFLAAQQQKNQTVALANQSSTDSVLSPSTYSNPKSLYDRTRLKRSGAPGRPGSVISCSSERPWYEVDEANLQPICHAEVSPVTANETLDMFDALGQQGEIQSPGLGSRSQSERTSRISQKIKFRNRNLNTTSPALGSAPPSNTESGSGAMVMRTNSDKKANKKSKENRRHTLSNITDMEQIKSILFGGASSNNSSIPPKPTDNQLERRGSSGPKQFRRDRSTSRTDRIKSWFKESFRRSSPDLSDIPPDDPCPSPKTVEDQGTDL